jgi:short-subunit dehydrogenase
VPGSVSISDLKLLSLSHDCDYDAGMPRQLSGSVVVITGASAGIGRELAMQLHEAGAKLVLAARRIDRLEALNESLGGKHLCVQVDVSRPTDCNELIEQTIEQFGRIDTLVCNAGYGFSKPVHETTTAEMQAIFRANVFGTTDCIHAAVPHLRRNEVRDGWRGQIMIVSSALGRRGMVYMGPYSATKAAQLSIAESLRVELKDDEIAVTSVHPITTKTEFFEASNQHSEFKTDFSSRSPVTQSARLVARKMIDSMRRPRRELWPYAPSRSLLSLACFVPVLGDFIMHRMKKKVDAASGRA